MYKDGGFRLHARAEHHLNAMIAWTEYQRGVENNTSLLQAMDKQYQKKVEENRKYIKTVADVLLCTATQNIAQRGHRESEDSGNKGNFMAILELIAKHDPLIKQKMGHSNVKYTSNHIQNEILEVLADMVRKDIIEEVKDSGVFSILADETKDLKKEEQISLVLRYYYRGTVHESFMHFEHADKLDAAGLTEKIVNSLQKYGLEYREQLVGQGYDGASVMSGKHSGVSARIQSLAKHAFYVHCNAHCLNLVIVDTVRAVPEASCFFSLLQRLYVFLSGSYVHQKWQDIQRSMYQEDQPRELPRLSDIRWACRYYACRNLMDRLPAVLQVLHDIDEENNGDRSVEARGLRGQINLDFIGLLATFRRILGDTKFLSDMLQSPSLDLARAIDLIEALQDSVVKYRDESSFDQLWTEVLSMAQQCNISTERMSKRQLKTSSALNDTVVMSTVGQRYSDTGKDYFCKTVYYPILDHVNAELERRFSRTNCDIMRGIQALNPKSNSFLEEAPLFLFGTIYETNLEDLKHELHQAKRILKRKEAAGMRNLTSLLEFTEFLEPFKEVFYELFRLCKTALVLPVSTAACERSFSALKLIKNHLRTTMNNERLSDLGVLSVESKRAKALDMDEFVRLFSSKHGNRKIQLF
uniref:DUF4371 domain-containing protein n=1 Tax=Myripristis murdjan TaxID=586833 RepID=A0A667WWJ6_9TELE